MKGIIINRGNPGTLNTDLSENVDYDYNDFYSYIRRGRLSCYPNHSALCHWHPDIEFVYILDGTMDYQINEDIVTLKKGDGLFVNSKHLHYGFSKEHKECDFLCVLLHPLLLNLSSSSERDYIIPITNNTAFPFLILHDTIPWEAEINKLIYDLYFHPNENAKMLQIEMAFCKIWTALLEHAPQNSISETKSSYEQLSLVKAMTSFIETHYSQYISISDIAFAGNVSVSKCYRLFHAFLGMTPSEYLCRYRLDRSIQLMETTDQTIIEIALSVGFHGASYFSESFKKYYYCSPSAYRNKNKTT